MREGSCADSSVWMVRKRLLWSERGTDNWQSRLRRLENAPFRLSSKFAVAADPYSIKWGSSVRGGSDGCSSESSHKFHQHDVRCIE